MARTPRRVQKVEFNDDLFNRLGALAADIDLNTASFVRGIVLGAIEKGIAVSLVQVAVERKLMPPPQRRARRTIPWESDGENWHYEGWTLVRRGSRARSERNKLPGDGWYLFGPSFPEDGLDLKSMARVPAQDLANDLIHAIPPEPPTPAAPPG